MAESADRRIQDKESSVVLKRELNEAQLATLNTLERFGWELKFIRHQAGHTLAVLFDPDSRNYSILGVDGEVDENPIFETFR